jgi:hypothetical protein
MRPEHRRLVTGLTWPLLLRYGYLGHGAAAERRSTEAACG